MVVRLKKFDMRRAMNKFGGFGMSRVTVGKAVVVFTKDCPLAGLGGRITVALVQGPRLSCKTIRLSAHSNTIPYSLLLAML